MLRRFQTALRPHGIGIFLALRHRLAADLAGGIHGVLRLDGIDDFRNGDAHLRQTVGPDPKPHGVIARAENRDAGDARHARHQVVDVDDRVVGQKHAVVGVVRRIEREHDQRRGGGFLDRDALIVHRAGQLRGRLALPHLRENLVGVRIGLDVEIHRQLHRAVVGVQGIHVFHVVHAGHLLLDGRGHRLFNGGGVRARIGGVHLDLRIGDVGKLRDGQTGHRNQIP